MRNSDKKEKPYIIKIIYGFLKPKKQLYNMKIFTKS